MSHVKSSAMAEKYTMPLKMLTAIAPIPPGVDMTSGALNLSTCGITGITGSDLFKGSGG
jgi:hypothetical protein